MVSITVRSNIESEPKKAWLPDLAGKVLNLGPGDALCIVGICGLFARNAYQRAGDRVARKAIIKKVIPANLISLLICHFAQSRFGDTFSKDLEVMRVAFFVNAIAITAGLTLGLLLRRQ